MAAVIYLHGFLSSPLSQKAQQAKRWVAANTNDVTFHCPHLTPYPAETQGELKALIEFLQPEPIWLIGSSLGGFWATWLAERYNLPAVLVNPSVSPWQFMPDYIGVDLDAYHTDDSYRLEQRHLAQIKAADCSPIKRPDNYWLMVQTGDETLDYRQATDKYAQSKQLVEPGGDHSFAGFEQHLPQIFEFFRAFERDRS